MKKLNLSYKLLLGALMILAVGQSASTGNAPQMPDAKLVRFMISTQVNTPQAVMTLSAWLSARDYDVAGTNWRKGQIEVITTEDGVQTLRESGLDGVVTHRQSDGIDSLDSRYLNPTTLEQKLTSIHNAYPQLTRMEKIGTSNQGRAIWALLVTENANANEAKLLEKPSILFDGLHHAREVMTPEIVVDVAEFMLANANRDPRVAQIIRNWNIWLVPMVNVDGSNIVHTSNNMWRKNARSDTGRVFGVDINRNYAFKWSACRGSSDNPSSETYHGSGPASEPETKALIGLAERYRPAAAISYHSYSEIILYPFGCRGQYTGEKEMTIRYAREMASLLPTDTLDGNYTPGTPWELLYDVDGDSMGQLNGAYGTLAYTFEVNQDFQPPYSLRQPTVEKHRRAWGYFMQKVDQNLLSLTVVDQRRGAPADALIAINTLAMRNNELPLKTNAMGHFFKVMDPGQYVISAKLPDGRTGSVTVQMNGAPQKAELVIQ